MIPTSMMYIIKNGVLHSTPRYGTSASGDDVLPKNYALFYPEKTGSIYSKNIIAKIFIIKNGETKEIKEFYSTKYGNNSKYLREAVESYIKSELGDPQQILPIDRRKRNKKVKTKRCRK